ncbi:MAG: hypothetical protein ACM3PY_11635 [Omnitrophica WOR_2 bacterium]
MFNMPKKGNPAAMSRKEQAIWLGRSLSSSEVAMRTLLSLVNVVAYQQKVIDALVADMRALHGAQSGAGQGEVDKLESEASEAVLKKLAEIESQLEPVLKVVDEACAKLEKEI